MGDTFPYRSARKLSRLVSSPQNVNLTADSGERAEVEEEEVTLLTWYVTRSNELSEEELGRDKGMDTVDYTEFFLLEYVDECDRVFVQDLEVEVFDCPCQGVGGTCSFREQEDSPSHSNTPIVECQCPEGHEGMYKHKHKT